MLEYSILTTATPSSVTAPPVACSSFLLLFLKIISTTVLGHIRPCVFTASGNWNKKNTIKNFFFKHNFLCQAICRLLGEPRRDPSNRRLNEHGTYIRHCQESNSQSVPSQAGVDTTRPQWRFIYGCRPESLWPSGISAHLGRNRLRVRFLPVLDDGHNIMAYCIIIIISYLIFIEPTITWVPSGFSRYHMAWYKIVFKKVEIIKNK